MGGYSVVISANSDLIKCYFEFQSKSYSSLISIVYPNRPSSFNVCAFVNNIFSYLGLKHWSNLCSKWLQKCFMFEAHLLHFIKYSAYVYIVCTLVFQWFLEQYPIHLKPFL